MQDRHATKTPYDRVCPRCNTAFVAVTERGICPSCGLFSLIRSDGSFVATCQQFTAQDGDEPFVDGPLADVYAAAAHGGAPLVAACRIEGFPPADVCHEQLRLEFQRLKALLESEIPDLDSTRSVGRQTRLDWANTAYEDAIEVHALVWNDDGHRIELVCSLTHDGGSIDLLCDGVMASYH